MAAALTAVYLSPKGDDFDDLTELIEHLSEYHTGAKADLYTVVQAIAEGHDTSLRVPQDKVKEFVLHMQEFRIEAIPKA